MREVILLSNGDFRNPVGRECWPKQEDTLRQLERSFKQLEIAAIRGHPYHADKGHGFITTQAEGCAILADIPPASPVAVVLSSWAWAHHVASGLKSHQGPILLVGNFDGTWPGLVALLNHSASFERMGIRHSRIWTDSFSQDPDFLRRLKDWIATGIIEYSKGHVLPLDSGAIPTEANRLGAELAHDIMRRKRILGQFDPGCMGMLNAVISPDKLAAIGMPVEYLSQSDLLAEMALVRLEDARTCFEWLVERGTSFAWGKEPDGLTKSQVLEQMKMYIAAGRIYSRYGLSAIGIPYQYGLVRSTAASDLPEGMLNNSERPEIRDTERNAPVHPGEPIIHFNEGDIGSGVPQVLMNEILRRKSLPLETTLHDVRWGGIVDGKFIWCLEISGGAPPEHFGGWVKTTVYRQPEMYFPKGGGTCSGVSRPGTITWARFYESFGEIGMDLGTGEVVELSKEELDRRRETTTREWPIANVFIPGYGRDELMAIHKSNHITICYGNIARELAATALNLGIPVNAIGDSRKLFG